MTVVHSWPGPGGSERNTSSATRRRFGTFNPPRTHLPDPELLRHGRGRRQLPDQIDDMAAQAARAVEDAQVAARAAALVRLLQRIMPRRGCRVVTRALALRTAG